MHAVCINMVMALSESAIAERHSQTEQVFPMSDVCSELLLYTHAGRSWLMLSQPGLRSTYPRSILA